ncbi:MAG: peptidylprolyl isomerase [Pirellulales bacterium]
MSQQEADLTPTHSRPPNAHEQPGATTKASGSQVARPAGASRRWRRRIPLILGALAVIGACVAIKMIGGRTNADAQAPAVNRGGAKPAASSPVRRANAETAAPRAAGQRLEIMAIVNGEEIQRQELARECLSVFGQEVLQSVVNKQLILDYCQQRQVTVTRQDVNDEIDRMARKFGLTTDQYLKMLQQERDIDPDQYATDIVWPMVALRRLAKDEITPTDEELRKAYESQYGEAVKVRIIVLDNEEEARRISALAAQNPDDFGALAKNHSKDPSAGYNGMIQPIRRNVGHAAIEKAAFALSAGQISRIIPLKLGANDQQGALTQYVILKCEDHLPPAKVNGKLVEERLRESIVEAKLRNAATEIFKQLQSEATVVNVFNDPVKSKQMPGVAATINGRNITLRELAEECLARHGVEVLEGTISRRLLEQGLARGKLTVTDRDIDEEIARAALAMGYKTPDGKPDVDKWLANVIQEQGLPLDVYRRDSVWPSVALKKLAGEVEITNQDLQKGYEANYGKRVRCRAIVLANQRRAQEVWEQARVNLSVEFFGQLAEEHSIEASSKALQGKVPPIQRHGGQPLLEKEAFSLKQGELSSIVQVGDSYVILFCEGFTTPTEVSFNEVRQDIYNDIQEKKQRIAMAEVFNQLKDSAQIDNFLAGTTQSPNKKASHTAPAGKNVGTPKTARSSAATGRPARTPVTR